MNTQLLIGAIIGTAVTTAVALYVNDKLTKRLREKTQELRKLTRQVFETELKAQELKQSANNIADKYQTAISALDDSIAQLKKCKAYTVRHTANSSLRLQDARTALNVVHTMADDFQRELEALLSQKVSDKHYEKFVAKYVPTPEKDAQQAITRAENTRSILRNLWTNDERVTPWKGTAYGVLQAVNTYRHHFRPTRGGTVLAERNYLDALTGKTGAADIEALKVLANFR